MYYKDGNLHVGSKVMGLIYTEEDSFVLKHPEYREEEGVTEDHIQEIQEFHSLFEIVDREALANTDFYQGMRYIFVVQRKNDGSTFGVQYFYGGGKYGESCFSEEADYNSDTYMLEPVEPHSIPTFKFKEKTND